MKIELSYKFISFMLSIMHLRNNKTLYRSILKAQANSEFEL